MKERTSRLIKKIVRKFLYNFLMMLSNIAILVVVVGFVYGIYLRLR